MVALTTIGMVFGVTAGCSDGSATVGRISPQELQSALSAGKAVVVDVRSASSYAAGHIKGAVNMTEGEIASRYSELPKNKKIVTYCS
jgi:rhodanese-related sulfurtransferase